jgi:tetratricopeptide (TPR) repeat protein
MTWTFTHAELEAERDAVAARASERPGKVTYQRLGRALRWLDEEDAARAAFRAGADYMRDNVLAKGRLDNATGWTEYGHLLRNAGDRDAARVEFARALEQRGDEQSEHAAQLRYLLGQAPGSAPDGPFWAEVLNALAAGERLAPARDAIVRAIRADRLMPAYNTDELSLWDLLEETFRVEAERDGTPVPDHATMLARTGLIGERAPASELVPPPRGRWTVGEAAIEQPARGPVRATLNPELWLEILDLDLGKWEVTLYHAKQGRLNESGPFDSFGEAVDAAKDALLSNADERAVKTLDALLLAY